MKNISLIVVSIFIILLIASALNNALTGFVIVGGGGAQGIGQQPTANPKYGTVYGNIVWEIKDGDVVISTDVPDQLIDVYFIPTGKIINWNSSVICDTEIKGDLNNIDADGAGILCLEKKYESPTAYECVAQDTDGQAITIYKTMTDITEGNIGCFALKIAPGEYDLYT